MRNPFHNLHHSNITVPHNPFKLSRSWRKMTAISLTLALLLPLVSCKETNSATTKTGFYFDTVIQITLYGEDNEDAFQECFDLADRYESLLSRTKEGSDIYRINHAGGATVTVSDETAALLTTALSYSRLTEGAFDVTIGALSDLWDFKNNTGEVPDDAAIKEAVDTVGYETVSISGNDVTLQNPDTRLDLGGIAKGYIADQMKELLTGRGITEGLINLGGNVLALGERADGTPYTVGIQKPFAEDGTVIKKIEITTQTVVTSGTYQRYFECNGTLYHHLLDPATGYPARTGLSSVTIICDHSVDGDALSTACFVMGMEKASDFISSLSDVQAIFITEENEVISVP